MEGVHHPSLLPAPRPFSPVVPNSYSLRRTARDASQYASVYVPGSEYA